MPNIAKLLEQNDAGFKSYTGIHKAIFEQMLEAMQEPEASKTKSGRPSDLLRGADLTITGLLA